MFSVFSFLISIRLGLGIVKIVVTWSQERGGFIWNDLLIDESSQQLAVKLDEREISNNYKRMGVANRFRHNIETTWWLLGNQAGGERDGCGYEDWIVDSGRWLVCVILGSAFFALLRQLTFVEIVCTFARVIRVDFVEKQDAAFIVVVVVLRVVAARQGVLAEQYALIKAQKVAVRLQSNTSRRCVFGGLGESREILGSVQTLINQFGLGRRRKQRNEQGRR